MGDVFVIGATAASDVTGLRQQPRQPDVVVGELGRVATVELLGLVEVGVAHSRGARIA